MFPTKSKWEAHGKQLACTLRRRHTVRLILRRDGFIGNRLDRARGGQSSLRRVDCHTFLALADDLAACRTELRSFESGLYIQQYQMFN